MNCSYKVKGRRVNICRICYAYNDVISHTEQKRHPFGFMCVDPCYGSISIVLDWRVGTSYTTFMIGERPITAQKFLFSFLYFCSTLNWIFSSHALNGFFLNLSKKAARNVIWWSLTMWKNSSLVCKWVKSAHQSFFFSVLFSSADIHRSFPGREHSSDSSN